MRTLTPCLCLIVLSACTSPAITSDTLSNADIAAISQRVQKNYPGISSDKQREVTALAVRTLDNMVFVKGGTFQMGDWLIPCQWDKSQGCHMDKNPDNDDVHDVKLSSFSISKYETTMGDFDLYRELQGKKPYRENWRESDQLAGMFKPKKPAWTKNWQETQDYCRWVGEIGGVSMDLPTEAQWEYAARSRGRWLIWATDNGEIDPGRNIRDRDTVASTNAIVGTYPPNPLGLYDMSFNAAEWVHDWYSDSYYKRSTKEDPQGPRSGVKKVVRGGTNVTSPTTTFTVTRAGFPPDREQYSDAIGFRCAIPEK